MEGVEALRRTDPDLNLIVERIGPPPLWGRRPGFSTLLRIILEQQVSLASGAATYARLQRYLGRVTPGRVAACTVAQIREQGVTRQKAAYVHGLAGMVAARELDLRGLARMDDASARETLCKVKGIGPWTADVYLLMALRRPDIWPPGDLALLESAKRVKRMGKRPDDVRMGKVAEEWRPWRAVAARLLWHWYLWERRQKP